MEADPVSATVRETVSLPNASAQLVRAPGVLPADGSRRMILYFHGGAFLTCGANSHGRLVEALSKFADSPVLVVNYRLLPKHSVGMALDDCHDAYQWLRRRGYDPDQIVLAGDSAGGYLALSLAQRLQEVGEEPAALVAISPLLQLAKEYKQAHPNIKTDAMFPARAFDALVELVASAAEKNTADGKPEEIYEPLEHIKPGLPRERTNLLDLLRRRVGGQTRSNHHKLVSAHAGYIVVLAATVFQRLSKQTQDPIPLQVPEAVVNLLETIHIADH